MNNLQITTQQQCCNLNSLPHFRSASTVRGVPHFRPPSTVRVVSPSQIFGLPKTVSALRAWSSNYLGAALPNVSLKQSTYSSGYHKRTPVCLFGGEGKSQSDDKQGSPFKVFEKGIAGFLGKDSVEDVLRKQIEKQEFYDDGGGDGSGPGGGSGGGDGSGSGGGSNGENFWDELGQVFLATFGLAFLYMLLIDGEQIIAFIKDIIKFIFTRRTSIRLRRLINGFVRLFKSLTETKEEDPEWLENAIINTPTWWDSPAKYKLLYRRYLASRRDDLD